MVQFTHAFLNHETSFAKPTSGCWSDNAMGVQVSLTAFTKSDCFHRQGVLVDVWSDRCLVLVDKDSAANKGPKPVWFLLVFFLKATVRD